MFSIAVLALIAILCTQLLLWRCDLAIEQGDFGQ